MFKKSGAFFRLSWLVAFSLITGMGARATPQAPQKGQDLTIRTTTRIVELSVVATDSKGRLIEDLKQDEVELLDAGKLEQVSVFSVEARNRRAAQPLPTESNVFTNRNGEHTASETSINIILIDTLNTSFTDQAYSKDQIIKFLQQLRPEDRVALYVLSDNLRVLHDFTQDSGPLLEALQRFRGGVQVPLGVTNTNPGTSSGQNLINGLNSLFNRSELHAGELFTRMRVEKTLRALEAIGLHTSRFPGRKNLLWVSGGFPFWMGLGAESDGLMPRGSLLWNFSREIARTARILSDANLVIYPVDAKGLGAPEPPTPLGIGSRGAQYGPGTGSGSLQQSDFLRQFNMNSELLLSQRDSMLLLAERTGGQAFYNTNDITGAIRRAVDDSRVTYLVGYYPTHGIWDGKFHEIKLKSKRKGLTLHYRRGYFASPDKAPDDAQRRLMIDAAILSPLEATAIGIDVKVVPATPPGANSLVLLETIDPRSIVLNKMEATWTGKIEIVVGALTPEGNVGAGESKTYELNLKPETYERMMQTGLRIRQDLNVPPGTHHVRLVIYDCASGALGSVTIPLTQNAPSQ